MTNKFKVGDMVRILNVVDSEFKEGAIGVIEDCDHSGYREWKVTVNGDYEWFDADEFELVEATHKDSERIAKLEEEVAELKLIVEQIRKPSPLISAASIIAMTEEPKTANQLRAEIIEKAKEFVETHKYYGIESDWESVPNIMNHGHVNAEFHVNEEKRTVVTLLRSLYSKTVKSKGIAKCMPSDVYNEHIGKAISLGRALGLDVSKFEQAVQPTGPVVGQIYRYKFMHLDELHEITGINETEISFKCGNSSNHHDYERFQNDNELGGFEITLNLINDTNAQYGGVE